MCILYVAEKDMKKCVNACLWGGGGGGVRACGLEWEALFGDY